MRQYPSRLLGPTPVRRGAVLGLIAALVVAGWSLWWFQPFADVAHPGDVVTLSTLSTAAGSSRLEHLADAVVELPGTTVSVGIGAPIDVLPRDVKQHVDGVDDDLSAPRRSVFVPVTWRADVAADDLGQPRAPGLRGAAMSTFTLALHAGDRGIDLLGSSRADDGGVAVVVSRSDVDDLTVDVGFDGVVQHVHTDATIDTGVAQPLYDDTSASGVCRLRLATPLGEGLRDRADTRCEYEVGSLQPWDPEQGWVTTPGQGWLLAHVTTGVPDEVSAWPAGDGGYARARERRHLMAFGLRSTSTSALADDVPADVVPQVRRDRFGDHVSDDDLRWFVDSTPRRLRLSQTYDLTRNDPNPWHVVPAVTFRAAISS